jgi:hypothetical protein
MRAAKSNRDKRVDFDLQEIWFEDVRNNCIKCLSRLSESEFVVNKDMAYCDDCAKLLHLGESKESKQFQGFQDASESEGPPDPEAHPDPELAEVAEVAVEEGASRDQ